MKAERLLWFPLLLFLLRCQPVSARQQQPSVRSANLLARIEALYLAGQWDEILVITPAATDVSPDIDYFRGMALARLGRWQEARAAFASGRSKAPHDPRFLLELAGVAFREDKRGEARSLLKRALHLVPADAYANDFLASLYYLDGNLEAALKFWNRENKPEVRDLLVDPDLSINPALLDRVLTCAPRSLLKLREFYESRTRIESLDMFHSPRIELLPRDDGTFDMRFRAVKRASLGSSRLDWLFALLRDAPHLTVRPEFYDLGGSAWNSRSLLRWDRHKQRFSSMLSGPLGGDPRLRLQARLEARREHWDIGHALGQDAVGPQTFNFRALAAEAEFQAILRPRTTLKTALTVSDRRFSPVPGGYPGTGRLFQEGLLLKYDAGIQHRFSAPEYRLEFTLDANARLGKAMSSNGRTYGRGSGILEWEWLPRARGRDYRISGRIGAGKTAGSAPFDELFSLGLEPDNEIYLRGHPGTTRGKKGAGPLGRDFIFLNSGAEKIVYRSEFWELAAGPFLDMGRTGGQNVGLGSGWLVDAGLALRLAILGRISLSLSYGRNLQGNSDAFFARVVR